MNDGNSRKESETNFSSSLESTNTPHRSSASDSLRRKVRDGRNEKEEGKD
ncbi:unnamed protein product [Brassica oleracea var. botrytis]|uniref:(rape) hypothetical protein n=1 Tax=Brassica napus TaxID=3708 RepID=A0A816UQR3_BRANA|nr:unnamed protein product [Brassica napus]